MRCQAASSGESTPHQQVFESADPFVTPRTACANHYVGFPCTRTRYDTAESRCDTKTSPSGGCLSSDTSPKESNK